MYFIIVILLLKNNKIKLRETPKIQKCLNPYKKPSTIRV